MTVPAAFRDWWLNEWTPYGPRSAWASDADVEYAWNSEEQRYKFAAITGTAVPGTGKQITIIPVDMQAVPGQRWEDLAPPPATASPASPAPVGPTPVSQADLDFIMRTGATPSTGKVLAGPTPEELAFLDSMTLRSDGKGYTAIKDVDASLLLIDPPDHLGVPVAALAKQVVKTSAGKAVLGAIGLTAGAQGLQEGIARLAPPETPVGQSVVAGHDAGYYATQPFLSLTSFLKNPLGGLDHLAATRPAPAGPAPLLPEQLYFSESIAGYGDAFGTQLLKESTELAAFGAGAALGSWGQFTDQGAAGIRKAFTGPPAPTPVESVARPEVYGRVGGVMEADTRGSRSDQGRSVKDWAKSLLPTSVNNAPPSQSDPLSAVVGISDATTPATPVVMSVTPNENSQGLFMRGLTPPPALDPFAPRPVTAAELAFLSAQVEKTDPHGNRYYTTPAPVTAPAPADSRVTITDPPQFQRVTITDPPPPLPGATMIPNVPSFLGAPLDRAAEFVREHPVATATGGGLVVLGGTLGADLARGEDSVVRRAVSRASSKRKSKSKKKTTSKSSSSRKSKGSRKTMRRASSGKTKMKSKRRREDARGVTRNTYRGQNVYTTKQGRPYVIRSRAERLPSGKVMAKGTAKFINS